MSHDLWVVSYDTVDGAEAKRWTFGGEGADYGQAITVAPDGSRFYVTGVLYVGRQFFDFDYLTLAYCTDDSEGCT